MSALIQLLRCGPLTTIQDAGRFNGLRHGVSASGPMDAGAFARAGNLAGTSGTAGIEFTTGGIALRLLEGSVSIGWSGGDFRAAVDGVPVPWSSAADLQPGSVLEIAAGAWGNFGYLRFSGEIDVPALMGSRATSMRARIGGLDGRVLQSVDELTIIGPGVERQSVDAVDQDLSPVRFIWGVHAEQFTKDVPQRFVSSSFFVTAAMDRMGFRLKDAGNVFEGKSSLSLVSEPVLPGDVQILGDGTPIVLMRDHQPTGGYPRIATVIRADLDRLAQMRPGTELAFTPVTVEHAQALWRSRQK
ncbi:biotin-dependent carboxyltransferase [Devosia sp. WQ 349]|uniref:5-oxoprolinase subunit C family protein n=1 Tax=Devosia sp. WQ 349K1 TaxID=2800329 RepID=UPI001907DBC0|nr:biotin-dependent carboxyltransferase family protein [Devosia sp. WQ 349K1]MBK1793325.1 biotin-dependent carboxyltransferase [Devosia sp. WQ 349K1]